MYVFISARLHSVIELLTSLTSVGRGLVPELVFIMSILNHTTIILGLIGTGVDASLATSNASIVEVLPAWNIVKSLDTSSDGLFELARLYVTNLIQEFVVFRQVVCKV